jgi:hypothetical protein
MIQSDLSTVINLKTLSVKMAQTAARFCPAAKIANSTNPGDFVILVFSPGSL